MAEVPRHSPPCPVTQAPVKPTTPGAQDDAGEHPPLVELLAFCALVAIWALLLLGAGAELILTGHLFW